VQIGLDADGLGGQADDLEHLTQSMLGGRRQDDDGVAAIRCFER
jgi:hypothetical protein